MLEVRDREVCIPESAMREMPNGHYRASFEFLVDGSEEILIDNKSIENLEAVVEKPSLLEKYGAAPVLGVGLGIIVIMVLFSILTREIRITRRQYRGEYKPSATGEFQDEYADGEEGIK